MVRSIGAVALFAITAGGAGVVFASPEVELGGFIGEHVFSKDNELGVEDGFDTDSPESALSPGVRLGVAPLPYLSIEGEATLMPSSSKFTDTDLTILGFRVHGIFQPKIGDSKFRPFGLIGFGAMTVDPRRDGAARLDEIEQDLDTMIHLGAGLKYEFLDTVGARADLRLLLPPSSAGGGRTSDWEMFVGVYKTFGGGGDRSPSLEQREDMMAMDARDSEMAAAPAPASMPSKAAMLPASAKAGPTIVVTLPAPSAAADDKNAPDSDGDGVVDPKDDCPDTAEDSDGFLDRDGCPEPDNDMDTVADGEDKCPFKAEQFNGFDDSDGCPDELPASIARWTGVVPGIEFKAGTSVLTDKSRQLMTAMSAAMLQNKSTQFEIQVHMAGNPTKKARSLSKRRAEALQAFLVEKGVAPARLTAQGYGADFPVADNASAAGRARNERVGLRLAMPAQGLVDSCTPSTDGKKERDPGCIADADTDGLVDARDVCPEAAEDSDGFLDMDGCPESDNDADGIADAGDRCPMKPETANGYDDNDGCPDIMPSAVAHITGIAKGISFIGDTARLTKDSSRALDQLADLLDKHRGVRLEIQAHTYAMAREEAALTLTQQRAEAIADYLSGRGVESDRLTAKGYGSEHPIAGNRGKDRMKNRRVSFLVLVDDREEVSAQPTTL